MQIEDMTAGQVAAKQMSRTHNSVSERLPSSTREVWCLPIIFSRDHQQLAAESNLVPKMKHIFSNFLPNQLSTYSIVIVIFVYNVVLDRDLECSCDQQQDYCDTYMALPYFTLLVLQLWMDKTFQRVWKYICACSCGGEAKVKFVKCKFVCILVYDFIKAGLISLMWVVSVLIDGDWYVCCHNSESEHHPDLACRVKNNNVTLEEQKITAGLKGFSLFIGLWIIFGSLLAAALMSLLGMIRCCGKGSDCCRDIHYYKVILEEEEDVMKEILTTAAKEKLTEEIKDKLSRDPWTDCFDAAEELINSYDKRAAAAESQDTQLKKRRLQVKNLLLEKLELEKLELEVKILRAEVKRLEPDTAEATGADQALRLQWEKLELEVKKLLLEKLERKVKKLRAEEQRLEKPGPSTERTPEPGPSSEAEGDKQEPGPSSDKTPILLESESD